MFEKLKAIIEDYNSIVIYGHPNPDGDCYGSQLGLSLVKGNARILC